MPVLVTNYEDRLLYLCSRLRPNYGKPMPHFIVQTGTHCENGVCVSCRDKNEDGSPVIIESKHDLAHLFPGKYTLCTAPAAAPPAVAKQDECSANSADNPLETSVEETEPEDGLGRFGPDVTAEFEGAAEAGLEIRKRSGWHRIFSAETGELVHPDAEQKQKAEQVIAELITAFIEGS